MLFARLAGAGSLADEQTWADYRSVETAAVVAPIAEEVTARIPCVTQWQPLLDTGGRASARMRAALDTAMEGRLPTPPQDLTDVMALGLPAYASARAAVLDLVYAGYQLAQDPDDVKAIAAAHKQLNAFSMRPADLTGTVLGALRAMAGDESVTKGNWDAALSELATHLLDQMQAGITAVPATAAAPAPARAAPAPDPLASAWDALLRALASLSVVTKRLADGEQQAAGPDPLPPPSTAAVTRRATPQSTADHRLGLAALIDDYLTFFGLPYPGQGNGAPAGAPGRLALRLAELHAAVRSTSPIGAAAEQRLELIQASADTRTLLAPNRPSASKKLTGLQLHHFAAFYKGTWRANDWMWGRLDGTGWLVQVLLDPRRIMAVIDAQRASDATFEGQAWFYEKLCGIAGEPGPEARALGITEQSLRGDLAFLDDPAKPVPASLPNVALWVALPLQRYIAAEELTAVAGQIRNPANGSPHGPALGWLGQYEAALTGKPPGNVAGDILNPASIYQRLAEAKVPPRKRIDTFLGGLEALLGKAPTGVRSELGFLQKAEPVIPPALDALQSWAGEHLAAAARQGPLRPAFGEAWIGRVAATLSTCPIADETFSGEIGTPLFTRTVTQALAVATEAGTATSGKPPATLAPAISTARTVTTAAYLVTKGTGGGAKALIWLGLLALGVGIASMFVSIPIVGTVGLAVLFTGAILLGIGLWRRSLYVAGLAIALAIVLIAAAPWLPYLHRYLFSWLARTALPFMDHHPWVWTALFLLVLMPPLWMLAGEFSRRRLRLKAAQQLAAATPVNAVVPPVAGGPGQGGPTGNGDGPAVSTPRLGAGPPVMAAAGHDPSPRRDQASGARIRVRFWPDGKTARAMIVAGSTVIVGAASGAATVLAGLGTEIAAGVGLGVFLAGGVAAFQLSEVGYAPRRSEAGATKSDRPSGQVWKNAVSEDPVVDGGDVNGSGNGNGNGNGDEAVGSSAPGPPVPRGDRVVSSPSGAGKAGTADVNVAADMPSQLQVGKVASVACHVSRDEIDAVAGRARAEGRIAADPSRHITLEVLPRANVEVVGEDRYDVPVPGEGETRDAYFDIRPTHPGTCQVWVVVRQGPVPLLTLRLEAPAALEPQAVPIARLPVGARVAVGENTGLEDGTWLSVVEMDRGPDTVYRFELRSTALKILATFESPSLRDRAEYVANLYREIENRWLTSNGDVEAFHEELREFGGTLLSQLFPERLQEILWRLRDSLKDLIVLSCEPFIPWELVHLKEPGGPLPDETRFLAETGLVRWLYTRDNAYPPPTLYARPGRVRVLCPDYPDPALRLPQTRAEADFLTASLGASQVPAHEREVRALLRAGGFDILHFAGHGQADGNDIANAKIHLEGRMEGRAYVASTISATTVDQQARLAGSEGSKPLVVLNACQAGRLGHQMSSLGGFAQAFLERGAGAFISTMWSVGDVPSSTFVTTFYRELLRGQPISAAASRARQETRRAGDGTWLAYAVYAHPQAHLLMSGPVPAQAASVDA